MSHYTVMVIGDDPESQLQPFHEFECTGINDKYVQDVDITDDVKTDGLEYYGLEDRIVSSENEVDREGDHKYGYAIVQNGELVKAVNRTNPNKKWDWYVLGGRWGGYFKLKASTGIHGRQADQCRKREIDFEGMRDNAGNEAAEQYDAFHRIVNGRDIPSWDEIREKYPEDIERARKEYNDNQVVKDLESCDEFRYMFVFGDGPCRFAESRADFIQRARNGAVKTYAVVYRGEWVARGEMGWFGFSNDTLTEDEWNKKFNELLDNLPDDTLLSVYDCHI